MSKKSLTGELPPIPARFHEVEIDERFYVGTGRGVVVYKKISFIKAKRLFLKSPKSETRFFWPFSAVLLAHWMPKTPSLGDTLPVDAHGLPVPPKHSPCCDRTHDAKGPGACDRPRVEQPHADNGYSGPSC